MRSANFVFANETGGNLDIRRGMNIQGSAKISECGQYRYQLGRQWGSGAVLMFLMLNPSTADAERDDQTIKRCLNYAQRWGYGALCVGNLFAWRATYPRELRRSDIDPVGQENDAAILEMAKRSECVVAAWGDNGRLMGRGQKVRKLVSWHPNIRVLRFNKSGEPSHPLRLRKDLKPVKWSGA